MPPKKMIIAAQIAFEVCAAFCMTPSHAENGYIVGARMGGTAPAPLPRTPVGTAGPWQLELPPPAGKLRPPAHAFHCPGTEASQAAPNRPIWPLKPPGGTNAHCKAHWTGICTQSTGFLDIAPAQQLPVGSGSGCGSNAVHMDPTQVGLGFGAGVVEGFGFGVVLGLGFGVVLGVPDGFGFVDGFGFGAGL